MSNRTNRLSLPIVEMDCPTCASIIEKELKKLGGVADVRVNFLMKKVVVTYDPTKIGVLELEGRLEDLGYRLLYKKYGGFFERFSKALLGREESMGFMHVSDHDFENLVLKSNKPVVLLFASSTCPSCKALRPWLKAAFDKFPGQGYLYEMDIMKTKRWEDYDVMSVPTVLCFKDGNVISREEDLPKQEEIEEMISKVLEST